MDLRIRILLAAALTLVLAVKFPVFPADNHVLQLDEDLLEEAVYAYDALFVLFCDKETAKCQRKLPELAVAAHFLHQFTTLSVIGIVETTSNPAASNAYRVGAEPVQKLFRGHADRLTTLDYQGPWAGDKLASWILEQAQPRVVMVSTPEQLEAIREMYAVVVAAYLDTDDGEMRQEFDLVGEPDRNVILVGTTSGSLHPLLKSVGNVVLFNRNADAEVEFKGIFEHRRVTAFVQYHKSAPRQLVTNFIDGFSEQYNELAIFSREGVAESKTIESIYDEVIKHTKTCREHLLVSMNDPRAKAALNDPNGAHVEAPFVVLSCPADKALHVFPIYGELFESLEVQEVSPYLIDFQELCIGEIEVKPKVVEAREYLIRLTSKTHFESVVMNNNFDVLLLVYDSRIIVEPHSLLESYRTVANEFGIVPNIVVGALDVAKTDDSFATLLNGKLVASVFFPGNLKPRHELFRGSYAASDLIEFLKTNAQKFLHRDGKWYGKRHEEL